MISLNGGIALAAATVRGVVISGLPSWVVPSLGLAYIVSAVILSMTVIRFGGGGFAMASAWVFSFVLVVVVGAGMEFTAIDSNLSVVGRGYGVSDVEWIGESSNSITEVSPEPIAVGADGSSDESSGDVKSVGITNDEELIPSGKSAAHPVSFRDAHGGYRTGYVIVSGNRARLCVNRYAVASESTAKSVSVVDYANPKTAAPSSSYDYGRHRRGGDAVLPGMRPVLGRSADGIGVGGGGVIGQSTGLVNGAKGR